MIVNNRSHYSLPGVSPFCFLYFLAFLPFHLLLPVVDLEKVSGSW